MANRKLSKNTIRRLLKRLDSTVKRPNRTDSVPVPTVAEITPAAALAGLKSGEYVLLNRPLLDAIIEELSA